MTQLKMAFKVPTSKKIAVVATDLANQISKANLFSWWGKDHGSFAHIDGHYVERVPDMVIDELAFTPLEMMGKASPSVFTNIRAVLKLLVPKIGYLDVNIPKHANLVRFRNVILEFTEDGNYILHQLDDPNLPDDYFTTIKIPHDFDRDAPEPRKFLEFLDHLTRGDHTKHARILEMMGYFLTTTNPYRKAWLVYGPTTTGKTTLLDILAEVLGRENCAEMSMKNLCELEEGGHDSFVLEGKLMIYKNEIGGKLYKRHMDAFKDITGNKRVLNINQKFHDQRDSWFTGKIAAATNTVPAIDVEEEDGSVFIDRWIVEVADNPWTGEKRDIVSEIAADPDEMTGILKLMVEGMCRITNRREIKGDKDAVAIWMADLDPLRAFFADTYTRDLKSKTDFVTCEDFYTAWEQYREDNGIDKEIKKASITRWLANRGIRKDQTRVSGTKTRQYIYTPLRVKRLEDEIALPSLDDKLRGEVEQIKTWLYPRLDDGQDCSIDEAAKVFKFLFPMHVAKWENYIAEVKRDMGIK